MNRLKTCLLSDFGRLLYDILLAFLQSYMRIVYLSNQVLLQFISQNKTDACAALGFF